LVDTITLAVIYIQDNSWCI